MNALRRLAGIVPALLAVAAGPPAAGGDTYRVVLDPGIEREPASGRVILFFVTDDRLRDSGTKPATGPFWEPHQPIASVAVAAFSPGDAAVIDAKAVSWPDSLDALEGDVLVQAVLDADETERSHLDGPGNMLSEVARVRLRAGADDEVTLTLREPAGRARPPRRRENLEWVELRSELLSAFYGRAVMHRAGVALPAGYAERERWPAVYVIPSFGDRHDDAVVYAEMLSRPGVEEIAPIAVHVVLDPESPLGHHGFVDSPNHGPRERALVTELIPHLEERFRLDPRPEARIVTGHSSGGWSSLWLQIRRPEVFGACWSSSPDPIDFSAFQMNDLYGSENLYVGADGSETSSLRRVVTLEGGTAPVMTVRQECRMEHAMHPLGGSGQQWDTWEAMFSPRDPATGYPKPMFDAIGGAIDRDVVEHWSRFDITRMVAAEWDRLGPVVMERVRLICGELDSFHLERAVKRFKETVEAKAAASGGWSGPGYVRIVPDATHNLAPHIFQRVNAEMREHLRQVR